MKKNLYILMLIALITTLLLAACGGATNEGETSKEVVPDQYASMTNPDAGNADAAAAGKVIFDSKCATCHGETGKGDGAGGAALNPKPADLAETSGDSDGLLYWRVAEGGTAEPFKSDGSAMPAWKDILSEEEIWQVITYIRTFK